MLKIAENAKVGLLEGIIMFSCKHKHIRFIDLQKSRLW